MASTTETSLRRRADRVLILAVIAELALVASTWRIWFCATDFPRVPLLASFLSVPASIVMSVSGAFVICLIARLACGRQSSNGFGRLVLVVATILGTLAACCNLQCLQPWHWLFLLTMTFRLILRPGSQLLVLRTLVACIYLFAAVSRMGPRIDEGMTPRIVTTLLEMASLPAPASTVAQLSVTATLVELVAGCLLLSSAARPLGMFMAYGMHVILLVALGPLGLNQHAGVLIWNTFLAVWVLMLYRSSDIAMERPGMLTRLVSAGCYIWPVLALLGLTDNWTGWQLYSPRPETLQLEVHVDALPQLPQSLVDHVQKPRPLDDWCIVRLDRWSLADCGVPLYPQGRFQVAVANWVVAGITDSSLVRATLWQPGMPAWWRREHVRIENRDALQLFGSRYFLNSQAVSKAPAQ